MDSVATMGEMATNFPKEKCLHDMLLNKTEADYTKEHQSYSIKRPFYYSPKRPSNVKNQMSLLPNGQGIAFLSFVCQCYCHSSQIIFKGSKMPLFKCRPYVYPQNLGQRSASTLLSGAGFRLINIFPSVLSLETMTCQTIPAGFNCSMAGPV